VVGVPCKFSKTSGFMGGTGLMAAPELGQHTGEVILEAGYARADIAEFKDRKII
jgi:crotonobetainyl-CoA:carnitine CoA-transferase CaiB-like acyl-CoA transferase